MTAPGQRPRTPLSAMSLIMQGRRLAAAQTAAAVRLLASDAAAPTVHSALGVRAAPFHRPRSMSTAAAAADLWAPSVSPSRPATAALSAAAGLVSEWTQRIAIWLAAPKSKITAHRRGQKRQHQKLKWAPVMARCPKCDRVMREREVVSRCPQPECPCGVPRPAAAKLQQAAAQEDSSAVASGN